MSEPAGAAGSPIAAEVIPQLAAAAAQIAAAHEGPAPASVAVAPTTRVKALDVLFRGSTVPASHDAPSYAVVMTGHFASYQGPHSRLAKLPPRPRPVPGCRHRCQHPNALCALAAPATAQIACGRAANFSAK
jgi:hypothetical protein